MTQLKVFATLWGQNHPLSVAIEHCVADGYDGLEGQAPSSVEEQRAFRKNLDDANLDYNLEICTAGSYVPRRDATVEQHLESFRRQIEIATVMRPVLITSMAGCDAWSQAQSVDFFGAAHEYSKGLGLKVCFETHRGRSFFNPWVTRDLLLQLPDLRLTCDFSHWCVVCERLIDSEPDVLQLCAQRADHIHARVGYDQGPQVSDPRAPEYSGALEAHERWWQMIWSEQQGQGRTVTTMTMEAGPDGYMQQLPYTQMPLADLRTINKWMAQRQREQFAAFLKRNRP